MFNRFCLLLLDIIDALSRAEVKWGPTSVGVGYLIDQKSFQKELEAIRRKRQGFGKSPWG